MSTRLRVELDNGQLHVVFRGMNIPVNEVAQVRYDLKDVAAVLARFPQLSLDDLVAARAFERELMRIWVRNWAYVGPLLQQMREIEYRESDEQLRRAAVEAFTASYPPSSVHWPRTVEDFEELIARC